MSASLKHYLQTIEDALRAGQATEHTHRPALKALLEALDLQITATNEPKRIACGAPDYLITWAEVTIGYANASVGQKLRMSACLWPTQNEASSLNAIVGPLIIWFWPTTSPFATAFERE